MADRWEERNRNDVPGERYRDRDDRGAVERAGDEVRSWFGDEDAARRRRMDEVRHERQDRDWGDRMAGTGERAWERTRDTVRDATDRDRDGRRGIDEWRDSDRAWDRPHEPRPSYGGGSAWATGNAGASGARGDYWSRERSFGDTSRYATADPYAEQGSIPRTSPGWSTPSYGVSRERLGPNYAGRGPRGYQRGDERIDDARHDEHQRLGIPVRMRRRAVSARRDEAEPNALAMPVALRER